MVFILSYFLFKNATHHGHGLKNGLIIQDGYDLIHTGVIDPYVFSSAGCFTSVLTPITLR